MDPVTQGGERWNHGNCKADPVVGVDTDGDNYEQETEIGWMPYKPVETACFEPLFRANGDVGAEGSAQRHHGCPANCEAEDQTCQADVTKPRSSAKHIGRMRVSKAGSQIKRRENHDPEKQE